MINNRNRGISRLGLIFNMSVNATTEMRNKNGPHPSTIPTIKRTTELVSTSAKPLKRPGEGETCVVDDETCVIDCETCVVDGETWVIDCETCVVDDETCVIDCETCVVDDETCVIDCETCVVDDETCVIDCETCVVDDETCVIDCETCVVDPTSAGSATIAPTDPENVLLGAAIIKAIPTKIIV